MLNVGGTKNLLFESLFHGAAKNLCSVALQDVVQPIDVMEPLPGSAVNTCTLDSRVVLLRPSRLFRSGA